MDNLGGLRHLEVDEGVPGVGWGYVRAVQSKGILGDGKLIILVEEGGGGVMVVCLESTISLGCLGSGNEELKEQRIWNLEIRG